MRLIERCSKIEEEAEQYFKEKEKRFCDIDCKMGVTYPYLFSLNEVITMKKKDILDDSEFFEITDEVKELYEKEKELKREWEEKIK